MMRLPTRLAALAGVLLLLSGTPGCFNDSAPTGDESGPRLRAAMFMTPRSSLSPLSDDAFTLARWNVLETLVDLDATGIPQPKLATRWRQRTPTEWVFTLREGVTFHDGTRFDATTAARSLTTVANARPLPRVLNETGLTAKAEGKELVVSTTQADPLLPNRLSSPSLAMLSEKAYQGRSVTAIGTGTGPFVLTSVEGSASARLDRHETYWNGRAKAAGIDASFVPDGTARAAALRTDTADVVEAIPAGQADSVDADLLHAVPTARTTSVHLNTKTGAFADPALRSLARVSIDTGAIVGKVYEGRADAAQGLLGPAVSWATEARKRTDSEAIVKTRAAAASTANGRKITLATYSDRTELPEIAVQVAEMLKAKGFTVEPTVREYEHLEKDALAGRFDAFIMSRAFLLDSGDPVTTMVSDYSCQGTNNMSHFCDAEVDKVLTGAGLTTPGEKRHDAIARAEALILKHDAVIPLLHERVTHGTAKGVKDTADDPLERRLITLDTTKSS